jgi:hypothetical protein
VTDVEYQTLFPQSQTPMRNEVRLGGRPVYSPTMNGSFAQVLSSPRLVEFHDQIGRTLAAERAARLQFFRDHLDEDRREEFINGRWWNRCRYKKTPLPDPRPVEGLVAAWVTPRRLGTVGRENALTEFPRNDYCPDLCFWTPDRLPLDAAGDDTRLVFPPPNFAVEVLSPGTERRDRGVKFEDYEAHGVSDIGSSTRIRRRSSSTSSRAAGIIGSPPPRPGPSPAW